MTKTTVIMTPEQKAAFKTVKAKLAMKLLPVKAWERKIRRSNKKFNTASPEEKRVMLAKDVLRALDARRIEACGGMYYPGLWDRVDRANAMSEVPIGVNLPLHSLMAKEPVRLPMECTVCAKGALFTARLDRLNGVDVSEEGKNKEDPSWALVEFFDRFQLQLIECAFERTDRYVFKWASNEDIDLESDQERQATEAMRFGYAAELACRDRETDEDEAVMEAIMVNIAVNNGTFVPDQKPRLRTEEEKKAW